MNWEAISAVAEIVGTLAVLVTLGYLALQVRQAHRQMELSGKRHRADAAREVLATINQSPDLARIFAKLGGFPSGEYGLESEEDTLHFLFWCHSWMRTEEMNFQTDSLEQRETQEQLLRYWLSNSWGQKFWTTNRAIYDASFAAHMDRILAEVEDSHPAPLEMLSNRTKTSKH